MPTDLFSQTVYRPLAARMRPATLDGFYGQEHLIGPGKPLREAIEGGDGNERWRVTSLQIDPSMSRWPFIVCEACATAAKAETDAAAPKSSPAAAPPSGWAEYYAALDEPMWLDGMMLHKSETRHGSIVTQM